MLNSSVRKPGKRELFYKMWNKNVDVETVINKCIPPASILDKILYSLNKRIKKVF
jgi:hypothetical protein